MFHNSGKLKKSKQLKTNATIATDKYAMFYEFDRFSLQWISLYVLWNDNKICEFVMVAWGTHGLVSYVSQHEKIAIWLLENIDGQSTKRLWA